MTPCRPAEYSTVSAGIFLPDSSVVSVPAGCFSHRSHRLGEPERHRQVAQLVQQRADDLLVAEAEHRRPGLHHGDLGAERGEHRRVLDADDPGADHHHRRRHLAHPEDLIGVDDRLAVEFDGRWPGRFGADPDDELVAADQRAGAVVR